MYQSRKTVPSHLRRFVVQQDYSQYNEVDQAVWRFVLLQLYARLADTAHPAYREGLKQTGISVERIPHIAEMDDRLAPFGLGAVCVDGFIPPRAFQEFQAAGLLPIAADMRTKDHLVYTPAPDIIHEAAGHAPILPDPAYSEYIRRSGLVGAKAFSSRDDARIYQAIFNLSEIKEDPSATAEQIQRAEAALEKAVQSVTRVSEATRVSRLYWWTAEYGLVGKLDDYRIYGAGILSSLWESYACHRPEVKKLPLTLDCLDVGYEITKPQPQLFVARDFEQLTEVLRELELSLAYAKGGAYALNEALQAEELCTLELSSGVQVSGVLSAVQGAPEPYLLRLKGPVGLALAGSTLRTVQQTAERSDYWLPLGRLRDGVLLEELELRDVLRYETPSRRIRLEFESKLLVEGRLVGAQTDKSGKLRLLSLVDVQVAPGSEPPLHLPEYDLAIGRAVVTAHAGAADPQFYPETEFSATRVPRPRTLPERDHELLRLYEQAVQAFRAQLGSNISPVFERIYRELSNRYPDEWLLRWNLLESLLKLDENKLLRGSLLSELEALEIRYAHREPIQSGLRYLQALAA